MSWLSKIKDSLGGPDNGSVAGETTGSPPPPDHTANPDGPVANTTLAPPESTTNGTATTNGGGTPTNGHHDWTDEPAQANHHDGDDGHGTGRPVLPTDYTALADMAMNHVGALQTGHEQAWGMSRATDFEGDLNEGWIRWTLPDLVAEATMQLLGTWNPADETFLWGWDHPSAPPGSAVAAGAVKTFADKHGISELQTAKTTVAFDDGWPLAAIAVLLGDLQGIYRFEASPGGPWAYVGFDRVRLSRR
ncbi:MAG: DUF6882 domain-containing protein [Acidimicrobiales bacterium]